MFRSTAIWIPVKNARASACRGDPIPIIFIKPMIQVPFAFLMIPPVDTRFLFAEPSVFSLNQPCGGFCQDISPLLEFEGKGRFSGAGRLLQYSVALAMIEFLIGG